MSRDRTEFEAVLDWLRDEVDYQESKFDYDEWDDRLVREGIGRARPWRSQLMNYLHRAHVLGLDTPVGRQALAKFIATAVALGEATWRVHGPFPPAGVPSGEVRGGVG